MKPALALLLQLTTPGRAPDEAAVQQQADKMAPADWPILAQGLKQQRVEALAGRTLEACPSVTVPDDFRESLRKVGHRNQLQAMKMVAEFRAISAACGAKGVKVVPLKGVDLVQRVYAHPGMRPFEDMDLFVRETDLTVVVRALRKMGYRTPARLLPHRLLKTFHFHLPLWNKEKSIFVEVHWKLADTHSLSPGSEELVWQAIDEARGPYPHLPDPLYACYLALHLSKHGYMNARLAAHSRGRELALHPFAELRLIWFVDLCHLLARVEGGPSAVLEMAESLGCGPAVDHSLAICRTLWANAPVVLQREPTGEGLLERRIKNRILTRMLKDLDAGEWPSGDLPWFLRTNKFLHVRPVRLLELGGRAS